jgi:VIT1/CCC1 family predicted Fe2+/Mn2+ transporter
MTRLPVHRERHLVARIGWLRAAVLGANDGIVSTASLIVGVAAAASGKGEIMVAGLAGLVAGAMSMAAGEYVSVSSQADTEKADIERERQELLADPAAERDELREIYRARGLSAATAQQVATELGAHLRDELGILDSLTARPISAAWTSAVSFALGAGLPLATAFAMPLNNLVYSVTAVSLLFLAALGAVGARVGGAKIGPAMFRVTFWGALAMAATAGIGRLVGTAV